MCSKAVFWRGTTVKTRKAGKAGPLWHPVGQPHCSHARTAPAVMAKAVMAPSGRKNRFGDRVAAKPKRMVALAARAARMARTITASGDCFSRIALRTATSASTDPARIELTNTLAVPKTCREAALRVEKAAKSPPKITSGLISNGLRAGVACAVWACAPKVISRPDSAKTDAAARAGPSTHAKSVGRITKITDSTRSSDTAAASADAPDKDRISPASKACAAAMRAKDA